MVVNEELRRVCGQKDGVVALRDTNAWETVTAWTTGKSISGWVQSIVLDPEKNSENIVLNPLL